MKIKVKHENENNNKDALATIDHTLDFLKRISSITLNSFFQLHLDISSYFDFKKMEHFL